MSKSLTGSAAELVREAAEFWQAVKAHSLDFDDVLELIQAGLSVVEAVAVALVAREHPAFAKLPVRQRIHVVRKFVQAKREATETVSRRTATAALQRAAAAMVPPPDPFGHDVPLGADGGAIVPSAELRARALGMRLPPPPDPGAVPVDDDDLPVSDPPLTPEE
jgi:hypothetical protein